MSDFLWPHRLQRTRLPCPSLSPAVCSDSCPLSQWCHSIISSSVTSFFSCPQSFPASVFSNESILCIRWPKFWSFSISPFNEYSALISFRIDSLLSKGLSGVFIASQFESIWVHLFWPPSHPHSETVRVPYPQAWNPICTPPMSPLHSQWDTGARRLWPWDLWVASDTTFKSYPVETACRWLGECRGESPAQRPCSGRNWCPVQVDQRLVYGTVFDRFVHLKLQSASRLEARMLPRIMPTVIYYGILFFLSLQLCSLR